MKRACYNNHKILTINYTFEFDGYETASLLIVLHLIVLHFLNLDLNE